MAIDKAVDSAQLNAGLTTIADAIREKAGVEDSFEFPTGFAEAIAAIESGGGLRGMVAGGYITPAEDQTSTTIDTGVLNDGTNNIDDYIFFLWRNTKDDVAGSYIFLCWMGDHSGECYTYGIRPSGNVLSSNTSSTMTADSNYPVVGRIFKMIVSGDTTANFTYGLVAGVEYGWAFVDLRVTA